MMGATGCLRYYHPSVKSAAMASKSDPAKVAQTLAAMDVWLLCPPKSVTPGHGPDFELTCCKGVRWVGEASPETAALAETLAARLGLKTAFDGDIRLSLLDDPNHPESFYRLRIDEDGVNLAATDAAGLDWGMTTLLQIARTNKTLPSLTIEDSPALKYRGVQHDISRGQIPTMATFRKLADVLAEAKMNVLELYIEHVYQFPSHPDIAPPDALTPEEARELFDYAAAKHLDVHALFQVLGHAGNILNKPQYAQFNIGPCVGDAPCTATFDIRKPEAVAFVCELVDDICKALPGEYLNIDITEINYESLIADGMTPAEVTDLIFNYVLEINEVVRGNGMRLMVAQGPLDSTGHLAGMGPKMADWPAEIMFGSYYCSGGCYQPAWDNDYPRFKKYGVDFSAQPWIYSHSRVFPWTGASADFSDLEVSRGLQFGAVGSVTTDWGDMGNYHLTGQSWYPYLYHGAVAWAGGPIDRQYFDQAFTRQIYGIDGDSVARAINLVGNVSAIAYKKITEDGQVVDRVTDVFGNRLIWSLNYLFADPFTDADLGTFAEPGVAGRQLIEATSEAESLLTCAIAATQRNRDNIDQVLLAAHGYAALGRKLVALGHYRDTAYPRAQVAIELEELADSYEALREDFKRLWLAEDRENANFHRLAGRFDETILPCRKMAESLRDVK